MRSLVKTIKLCLISVGFLTIAACSNVTRPEGVTAADVPAGASKFATDYTVRIQELANNVTDKVDPQDIDNYKAIAFQTLSERLKLANLEVLAAGADAPLKMTVEIIVFRWNPLIGGRVTTSAKVFTQAGKELYSAEGMAPLDLGNLYDSRIALKYALRFLENGIIEGVKPPKTS